MTQFSAEELTLSERVYQDNPSLHHQVTLEHPLVDIPKGWHFIDSAINDAHGFFAEAFTDDMGHIILRARP